MTASADFDKVMGELVQLRSEVALQKEKEKENEKEQKNNFNTVLKQMIAEQNASQKAERQNAQARHESLFGAMRDERREAQEEMRRERQEARREREQAQERQDLLVAKIVEQQEFIASLVERGMNGNVIEKEKPNSIMQALSETLEQRLVEKNKPMSKAERRRAKDYDIATFEDDDGFFYEEIDEDMEEEEEGEFPLSNKKYESIDKKHRFLSSLDDGDRETLTIDEKFADIAGEPSSVRDKIYLHFSRTILTFFPTQYIRRSNILIEVVKRGKQPLCYS